MRIILASKSPRRKEILESLGLKFEIITADADESSKIKSPGELVKTLAARKGRAVLEKLAGESLDDTLVIACDTLVYADEEFLGKPRDRSDAYRMLKKLSGKCHSVISGLYLCYGGCEASAYAETRVYFDRLSVEEMESYVASDEPYDKAGGYAVQGRASLYINRLEGDYFNVVGMPVNLLYRTLKESFDIELNDIK